MPSFLPGDRSRSFPPFAVRYDESLFSSFSFPTATFFIRRSLLEELLSELLALEFHSASAFFLFSTAALD